MITIKHPDKLEICSDILRKSKLGTIDIINLQKKSSVRRMFLQDSLTNIINPTTNPPS